MSTKIRRFISQELLYLGWKVLPKSDFKYTLARFLINNLNNI